jgi:LmbE family N-acetylglucosaminyl deacetylase
MKKSRMIAIVVSGLATAVCLSGLAQTVGKSGNPRTKTYVAACPPVIESIPRTPGPQRVMIIGAHPDDADIVCGCTAAKLVAKGARVKFVAVCNGNIGHHIYSREKTAAVRRQETLNAAKVLGLDSYDIYGYGDARVPNDFEARELVARKIQEFEPDIIITHRDCDYHVDHRTVGTLVKDCGYMLGCPHWIEGSKPLRRRPLILLMRDNFTVPRVMRPDILIDAEPYIGKWCDALDCQVSQFYEWLAWDKGVEAEVKAIGDRKVNIAARNAYLMKYWGVRKVYDANRFADAWREQYPGRAVPKMVEAYEISEYGRPPIEEDFDLLMGE